MVIVTMLAAGAIESPVRNLVPVGGMIIANAMKTTSLALDRFKSEIEGNRAEIDLKTGDTLRLFPHDRPLIIEPTTDDGTDGGNGADRGTRADVDRLHAMRSRHFQRSLVDLRETEPLGLEQSELYDYRTTGRHLERVGDHAEKIATLARQFEHPPAGEFAENIEHAGGEARTIVERAASTIIGGGDGDTAFDALDRRDELIVDRRDLERQLHERDVPESHLIALVLDSLMPSAEYGGNIAEAALQAAARRSHSGQ